MRIPASGLSPMSGLILLILFAAMAGLLSPAARTQPEPPIGIVIDIHMDPMLAFPLNVRQSVYSRWRVDTLAVLNTIGPKGARVSFLSCGEFMEYVVEEGKNGAGAAFPSSCRTSRVFRV